MDEETSYRFRGLEETTAKLTTIAGDMSRLLAVHENRLDQNEKRAEAALAAIETRRNIMDEQMAARREIVDKQISDIYTHIEKRDEILLKEVKDARSEALAQHTKLETKLIAMQRLIWMAMGAITIGSFIVMELSNGMGPWIFRLAK